MLSVGALVTRDIDKILVSADPAVTRDYRIDRNGTVISSFPPHLLYILQNNMQHLTVLYSLQVFL
jgi:hypothetical protein